MSEKRKNSSVDITKKKSRSHKPQTVKTKMDIIRRSENGESFASIARSCNLNRSTIYTIVKNKYKIMEYVKNCGNISSKIVSKRHGRVMDEMEKSLALWIEDQHQKGIPVSLSIIQAKALSLHENWKKELKEDSVAEFVASNGWFHKFKMRYSLDNIKCTGEGASADKKAANEFISTFSNIIKDGDYFPCLVFNVCETGLFWKKMPACTYLAKEESVAPGDKPSKNRLTLLLGGNLAGDFKLKPMLIYQTENPIALKGKDKKMFPVIWKSNPKACVTAQLFQEWFSHHFVPSVKQYCSENNLPFKILLLLGNSPGHPKSLQNLYPEINVFIPPNTAGEIQPMDQIVIATFKRYYMRRLMTLAIKAVDKERGPTLRDFWKSYNIWNAINIIGDAWAEIRESTMKDCWKKIYPQMMNASKDIEETPEDITTEIVNIMNELNLDVTGKDIDELMESHSELQTNEDLIELQEMIQIKIEEESDNELIAKSLTIENMNEAFMHLDQFLAIMEECDPNGERISHVRRAIEKDTECYRILYEEKKNIINF